MKKHKRKIQTKKVIVVIVILLFSLIIISTVFIKYVKDKNYFFYENKVYNSTVTSEEIQNSNLIIVNDIIIGANIENKWITPKEIYTSIKETENIKVDIYDQTKNYGVFETSKLIYNANSNILYTTTTRQPKIENYIALSSSEINKNPFMKESISTKKDLRLVKKALGKYRFLNLTVEIQNIYEVYVNNNVLGKIAFVTSKNNKQSKTFGIYNALIYIENNKSQIIKYAYVKDLKNNMRWPVYALNFVIDIDNDKDNISEIIISEIYDNNMSYIILKYKDKNFQQVLKTNINL